MEIIIGLSSGIAFFAISYLGFRTGLRLGMETAKGKTPPKISLPAKKDKQGPLAHELLQGYANMMAYNGDPKGAKK